MPFGITDGSFCCLIVQIILTFLATTKGQVDFGGGNRPQWDPDDPRYPGNKVIPECPPDAPWPCWEPPFYPYDPIRVQIPNIGWVKGRSMIFAPYQYVNWFLGVPYAKPPVPHPSDPSQNRRFKPPEDVGPGWDIPGAREWDASFYRPACPQEIWKLDKKFYEPRNISEDCLYLNIFRPNLTDRNEAQNRNFPVLVFIHGEDYVLGDGQLYPGHILAKKEILVVTFSYRLGALGFMSTLDDNSPGNYGIHDVIKVLEFVQKYIVGFGGDPDRVTIAGAGSGAGIVGILLVSPKSYLDQYRPLFHKAILMSGSDLCEWSTVDNVFNVNAREYAKELGKKVGCDPFYGLPIDKMVECMQYKHFEEIINATSTMNKAHGSLAGPFGPVVDGANGILPESPKVLRDRDLHMKIHILAGVNKDEGAYIVDEITKEMLGLRMEAGMDPGTFRQIIYDMVYERRAYVRNVDEVVDAMEFEYTFWAKPDNKTAVRQNLIDLWSDQMYGWCVDALLKYHADVDYSGLNPPPPVYMYVFNHRSDYEVLPYWMGVPHSKDVEYLFGYPFFNATLGNITGIVPEQWDYDYLDKNISVFVQDMWTNFSRYGTPTIDWTRNISWYPYSLKNLSYLFISEFSYMDINFRQNHYAFWREYYPQISVLWPITTTPGPTPRPLVEYQIATWAMMSASLIIIFVIGALGITLWRRRRSPKMDY